MWRTRTRGMGKVRLPPAGTAVPPVDSLARLAAVVLPAVPPAHRTVAAAGHAMAVAPVMGEAAEGASAASNTCLSFREMSFRETINSGRGTYFFCFALNSLTYFSGFSLNASRQPVQQT